MVLCFSSYYSLLVCYPFDRLSTFTIFLFINAKDGRSGVFVIGENHFSTSVDVEVRIFETTGKRSERDRECNGFIHSNGE